MRLSMSKHPFIKRNWKLIVNIITVAVLVLLVYLIRDQIVETFQNLGKVKWQVLLLILPLTALGYHAQTKMYQDMFALIGHKLHYKFMARVAVELNFVNQVFPSGGVSGISYFGVRMRSKNITGGKATVVQMMKLLLLFLSFEIVLIFGLLFMAIGGHVNNLVILVTSSVSTLLVVGTFAFVMIIGKERRINATFAFVTGILNGIVRLVRPGRPPAINTEKWRSTVEELHKNYKLIESQYKELKWPFFWALIANVSEVLAVYVVYIAFGQWVNLGSVILAYSIANFAGLVSVLPGGVGIYEALMTAVLVATGVPAAVSIPVTVMYRVLSMLVQLPPGYYYYHKTLHSDSGKDIEEQAKLHA